MKKILLTFALAIAAMPLTYAATKPAAVTPVKTSSVRRSKGVTGKHHSSRKSSRHVSHRRNSGKSAIHTASVRKVTTVKPR
ncbi:MAG TPA: hypothetical protein VKU19_13550 [Bryobacteraceae bacterium]|nr:hypothetical protein [Bryobacteraceae bacterium]